MHSIGCVCLSNVFAAHWWQHVFISCIVYISFQSVCLYDVRLSSLATSFGLCTCRVLFVSVKCFHCFVCWWPALGFKRICVCMHSVYLCTTLYEPYACIFVCICNYVCKYSVCVLLDISMVVYCFPYSECSNNSGNKVYSLKLHFYKDTENE